MLGEVGADVIEQREVLALFIDRVTLVRTGYRAYGAAITWTTFGEALRTAAECMATGEREVLAS